MAENADSIIREIKARKQAKKGGMETKKAEKEDTQIKKASDHNDLKEVSLRVEGRKW